MIRFSAVLVAVAVGMLVAGVVTSKLLLVYIAIGVSGVALLALGVGAAVNWRELTGKPETVPTAASAQGPAPSAQAVPAQVATPEPVASAATGPAASRPAWSATVPAGSSRSGYAPAEPSARTQPVSSSGWNWRDEPPSRPSVQEPEPAVKVPASAQDQPSALEDDSSIQDQTMIFRAQPDQTMIFRAQPSADASETAASALAASKPAASEPEPSPSAPATDVPAAADATPVEDAAPVEDIASDAEPAVDTAPAEDSTPADDTASADDADEAEPSDGVTTATEPVSPALDMEVTVVPGVPRYHKPRCILIRFMGDSDLDKMTVAAAREAGCTPCRACLPDEPGEAPELSGAPEPEPQA